MDLSAVPREARPYQGATAGLVSRSAANTLDLIAVCGGLLAAYLGLNGVQFFLHPRSFRFTDPSVFLTLAAALVALVLYLTATWCTTGRTYGDRVMGLRVLDGRGRRMNLPTAFVRAVFCVALPIGLLCCVLADRRSLQDLLLRTLVVYDWKPRFRDEVATR
ncbi:MAG: RDD family protein [Nocardioidaceae bacterium]